MVVDNSINLYDFNNNKIYSITLPLYGCIITGLIRKFMSLNTSENRMYLIKVINENITVDNLFELNYIGINVK